MLKMSREDMVHYLKEYSDLQSVLYFFPDKPICLLYYLLFKEETFSNYDTRYHYDIMRRIYSLYLSMRKFSIIDDFLLNQNKFLDVNDLADVSKNIKLNIPISGVNNRLFITFIRNAFNHNNDSPFNKFNISPNAKNINITFRNISKDADRVKPVDFQFSFDDLIKLDRLITDKRQNQLFFSYNISKDFDVNGDLIKQMDELEFLHYYFLNRLDKDTISKFNEFSHFEGLNCDELSELSKKLHDLSKSIGGEPKHFPLNDEQKRKVIKNIVSIKRTFPELLKNDLVSTMYYILNKVIPVPSFKIEIFKYQRVLSSLFFDDNSLSLNDVRNRIKNSINEIDTPTYYNENAEFIHNNLIKTSYGYKAKFLNNICEYDFIVNIPKIIYIDSVITNFCNENDYINIDGNDYKVEGIRNSLVHCRWFISSNNEIVLYDASPKNDKDYDLEYIGKINIDSFTKWADNHMGYTDNKKYIKK